MKRIFLLSCLILSSFWGFLSAQSMEEADSLWNVLPGQTDTTAIKTLLHIAKHHVLMGPAPDSAEYYGKLALEKSRQISFLVGEERALFCIAHAHGLRQEFEESNRYFEESIELLTRQNNQSGVAAALNNIGKNYLLQSEYEEALQYFLSSMRIEEELGESANLFQSYNNISIVHAYMEQREQALEYGLKAYRGQVEMGNTYQLAQSTINLVPGFYHLEMKDSAWVYANKALELCESIGMREGVIRANNHLALIALDSLNYEDAIRYAEGVLEQSDTLYHASALAHATRYLAVVYDSLDQPQTALYYANESLRYAELDNTAPTRINAYGLAYRIHRQMGNDGKALEYKEQFHELKDSVFTLEKERQITELQGQYNQERNKRALTEQAVRIQEKNYLILALVMGVLMLIALFFLYNRQQILKEKQQTLEARQRLLRTQINPHFLFNALSSIQHVIYEKEDRKLAVMYLTKFARLMRLILENSREAYIPLEQEVDTLRHYLELQKMRFQDAFEYEIYVDPEIDPEEAMIPPMFAQPFIENSLEHGILHKNEQGFIRLAFHKSGDMLKFEVEDNGVGREQAAFFRTNKEYRSLATEITRDRLNLLGKTVKKQINLEITDKVDDHKQVTGTKVTFSLPMMYG